MSIPSLSTFHPQCTFTVYLPPPMLIPSLSTFHPQCQYLHCLPSIPSQELRYLTFTFAFHECDVIDSHSSTVGCFQRNCGDIDLRYIAVYCHVSRAPGRQALWGRPYIMHDSVIFPAKWNLQADGVWSLEHVAQWQTLRAGCFWKSEDGRWKVTFGIKRYLSIKIVSYKQNIFRLIN